MPSIPLTPEEEKRMLSAIGVQSIDDLFASIPPKIREKADFKLPLPEGYEGRTEGLSEHELRMYFGGLAARNAHAPEYRHFLGGGVYDNIIPAIVDQLVLRGEFLTCYTPYQPEISQGTLQAIFEFQTLLARLTGMEVSNASLYDGPTAAAEAVLLAQRASRGNRRLLMAEATAPDTRQVVGTFVRQQVDDVTYVPWGQDGTLDLDRLRQEVEKEAPFALLVNSPNYFGKIEPLDRIREILPPSVLMLVNVPDASALALYEPPGAFGADVVVGEAHQFGTPMLFGGPHLGFFATRKTFLRQMPGRLVGETVDSRGNRCYTLTLSTREQHIRREKATSNICTNQGLIALRATIYLSLLGKRGVRRLAERNHSLFRYLCNELKSVGIPQKFPGTPGYREGVFEVPNLSKRFARALEQKLLPGIRMSDKIPGRDEEFSNSLLICVHPKHSKADIDALVEVLSHD